MKSNNTKSFLFYIKELTFCRPSIPLSQRMSLKRSLVNLNSLSKDELIKLISEKFPEILNFESVSVEKKMKQTKPERAFDASSYDSKMVALKVAYFGFKYQGFASQNGLLKIFNNVLPSQNSADTVEDHIFRAMIRTRLILDPKTCNYSRCGRTDAGVSSTGQVIALKLRTSNRKSGTEAETTEGIDYVNVLNKQLPDDIRILDWAFVPEDFSARFSCSSRLYHYHFAKVHYDINSRDTFSLDIDRMQEAAKLLVGVHDFRNFCKRDPSKPDQSFTREILECYVKKSEDVDGFYTFVCRGSAFLYHQIRCIMAILFFIGIKSEPVELIATMLERIIPKDSDAPAGPLAHYEIASGIPLTLRECFYEKPGSLPINWTLENEAHINAVLNSHLIRLWESKQGEALIISGLVMRHVFHRKTYPTNLLQKFIDASK